MYRWTTFRLLLWLTAVFLALALANASFGAAEDGESLMTPNQQKLIVRSNQELPKDLLDQAGDSKKVVGLRASLRKSFHSYQEAVRKFVNGTPQSRKACHEVVDAQKALHKQFVQEEAIPALASR